MKTFVFRMVCSVFFLTVVGSAQVVIPLYEGAAPGSTQENYPEKEYFSTRWNNEVVANVTKPTLTVYRPLAKLRNGTAIVICPGGGFMALSIKNEGTDVAKYLVARGVTAFVLRYRLAHTGDDAPAEFAALYPDKAKFKEMADRVVPLADADGLAAVAYVRQHAKKFGVSPDRVGIIGFSAGGSITDYVALHYAAESRPAFLAPIYSAYRPTDDPVPADAPPMFIAAASDDGLGLAPSSIAIFMKWLNAKKPVELHMYTKGNHGFGMRKQNLPTDHWIDRFAEWLKMEGFLTK